MSIGEFPIFTWVHVSDLHFGHGGAGDHWDQAVVLQRLHEDVAAAVSSWPELPGIDAIMVTGDVAFSGAARSADEYEEATAWLLELAEAAGIEAEQVYVVPGNHDVHRGTATDVVGAVRGQEQSLDEVLDDPERRNRLYGAQRAYAAFAERFGCGPLDAWVERLEVGAGKHICLVGLNTALLSNDDHDKGNLVLAERQLAHLAEAQPDDIVIALSHHPPEEGWLANDRRASRRLYADADIHLCGHVHRQQIEEEAAGGQHVRVVAAAAHLDPGEGHHHDGGDQKLSHGYNISSILSRSDGRLVLRVWPRRWFNPWPSFRVDHMLVPDRSFSVDRELPGRGPASGLKVHETADVGLVGVHWWANPVVQWRDLLSGTERLLAFGLSLEELLEEQGTNLAALSDWLKGGEGRRVCMLLADPRAKLSMACYDQDFDRPLGERSEKTVAALEQALALQARCPDQVEVRVTTQTLRYSGYRFDDRSYIIVPYALHPGKEPDKTPAFVMEGQSDLARRFFAPDVQRLWDISSPFEASELRALS